LNTLIRNFITGQKKAVNSKLEFCFIFSLHDDIRMMNLG